MTRAEKMHAAELAAASYVIRSHNGDQAVLRELLQAIGALPYPSGERRRARVAGNGRPPRRKTLQPLSGGPSVSDTIPGGYISHPDERLAWMLANAPGFVGFTPAAKEPVA